ncbi:MAG: Coenzyme F420 hydrogenase/dehydrogenase, beta subunit C-terminal domain [Clostridia bacterium]
MIEATSECTGCRACEQICPTKAIVMRENEEGFSYPIVNIEKCIHCALCDAHCHLLKPAAATEEPTAYAAINQNQRQLALSASGGIFAGIASAVLAQGGCVFGCAYDADMKPHHTMIECSNELPLLQGSKYVESDLEDCYPRAKQQLLAGRTVLFCGTGCQIAGLLAFLGKPCDNLLTISLICHGVPSRRLFAQHVEAVARSHGKRLTDARFRSKRKPAFDPFCLEHVFDDGSSAFLRASASAYYQHFLRGTTYRESCYVCRYASAERICDFTIGDYWGVERFHPSISASESTSVLLVHTAKGRKLLNDLHERLTLIPSQLCWVKAENEQLCHPSKRPEARSQIYRQIEQLGYSRWEQQYRHSTLFLKKRLRELIPHSAKAFLKRFLGKR